ncbi:hypothetical protein DMC47_13205 [Nostoc sp. 3335mG]|nr:hypothetical protein DMC47_13205 [Nostoc sp. 3335mG]
MLRAAAMAWDQRIFIAQLNVEHFRKLLRGELSGDHRRTVKSLLAEEETRLSELKSSVAEGELLAILAALAETSGQLLGAGSHTSHEQDKARVPSIIDRLPVAVGLIDAAGSLRISNAPMGRFVPERIPSRDSEQVHRWRFPTRDGGRLNPFLWPSARALRGETVTPGVEGIYTDDVGNEIATRVASFPVWQEGSTSVLGAVSAVYETEVLTRDGNERTLELILEEIAPVRKGDRQDRG